MSYSDEFIQDRLDYIKKLTMEREKFKGLLIKYREHVVWHEGIDYLRDGTDASDYLTEEEMQIIKEL